MVCFALMSSAPGTTGIEIAFVNATHRWGGVKTWTLDVAPRLAARGHGVHLYLRRDDAFQEACRARGLSVDTLHFGPDWNPLAVLRLCHLFRRHHIDHRRLNDSGR